MFEFSTYKLDPETVRLFRNDQELETEPQVFNTLLFLIENRHRVVSKEELFEEIWQGRTLTDHVITRIIYELRKLLDDKSQDESHIRTIRGKGYQFIADVVESSAQKVTVDSVPASEPLKSNTGKVIIYSLIILLPLMFGYWFSNQTNGKVNNDSKSVEPNNLTTLNINEPATAYPVVVVLPIELDEADEQIAMLTLSLIDYLTNQLELNLNMKVIHPDSLVRIGDDLGDVWSIQQATRANYILQSQIDAITDDTVNIQLNLYKQDLNEELQPFALGTFRFPFPQSSQDLSELYKQRKVTVRDIISIIKPGIVINDTIGTETKDAEAYRMAIAAHHMLRTDVCADMIRAEKLLLRAIERDPEFGFAYHQLFRNYTKRVWLCGESNAYRKKGLEMAEIAEKLSPNTYQSLAIHRNTLLVESNEAEAAYEFSRHADWNDPAAIYRAVYGLRYAGFLSKASDHLDRILQLDPYYFSEKPIQQSPSTLLYQNRFGEHIALLAEPGNSYHDYYRSLNLVLTDKVDEARPLLEAVVARTPDDLFGQFSQALLYVINGAEKEAAELIEIMLADRKNNNHNDGEMTYKLLQLYGLMGKSQETLDALQLAVDQGFFPFNYFLIDPALDGIRDTEQFTNIIQQAQIRHEAFATRFNLETEVQKPAN